MKGPTCLPCRGRSFHRQVQYPGGSESLTAQNRETDTARRHRRSILFRRSIDLRFIGTRICKNRHLEVPLHKHDNRLPECGFRSASNSVLDNDQRKFFSLWAVGRKCKNTWAMTGPRGNSIPLSLNPLNDILFLTNDPLFLNTGCFTTFDAQSAPVRLDTS